MKAPNPGTGWRLLRAGAVRKQGDEWYSDNIKKWHPVIIGLGVISKHDISLSPYRRPIANDKPIKKAPNYRLIALRMSKALTIGEAREIYKRGAK